MNISVRKVCEADAQSIVSLMNPIIATGNLTIMDQPLSVGDQEEFIRTFPDRGVFNLASAGKDDSIVGIQDIVPIFPRIRAFRHVCEIATFVSLEARRQGVGAALFRATVRSARDLGFAKIVASLRLNDLQCYLSTAAALSLNTLTTLFWYMRMKMELRKFAYR